MTVFRSYLKVMLDAAMFVACIALISSLPITVAYLLTPKPCRDEIVSKRRHECSHVTHRASRENGRWVCRCPRLEP